MENGEWKMEMVMVVCEIDERYKKELEGYAGLGSLGSLGSLGQ